MSESISGRVWVFGNDINTDLILPAPYMYLPQEEQARYVFQANRPGWVDLVAPGDVIVAGTNFGMGSSRPAPLALNGLKIGCLVADSINPLFLRNCVSFGLCALECPGVSALFEEGDVADVDLDGASVRNRRTGKELTGASLPGDLGVDSPAVNAHLLWNTDVGQNWNLELGASYLWAKRSADNATDVNLFGLDATVIHRDPTGRFNNQLVQAELIYGDVSKIDSPGKDRAWGGYLLAQQQLNRDWYTGIRLDYTENPDDDSRHAWAVTPYVSWYWSEFLRFRVMYQHKDGDVPAEDILYFQATWIFGAHPPHPYWSMQ